MIFSASRAKQFSGRMGNIWRVLSDVTYPIVAYTTVICVFIINAQFLTCLELRATNSIDHYTKYHVSEIVIITGILICLAGLLRPSHRRYVAPFLLQHNQHQHLPHGNSRDRIRLEIYTFDFRFNCRPIISDPFAQGASMTLIGLLPPLCENGNMLVDGGYSK